MKLINIEHSGENFSFNHREFCMFARMAIRHRAGMSLFEGTTDRAGHCYKQALKDAANELERLNIEFSKLKPWREPNIFTNGFADLDPPEITFLILSLKRCWLVGQPLDQVRKMDEAARLRAARKQPADDRSLDPRSFAEFLHLPQSGEQQGVLRKHTGDYLIFRRLRTTLRLSISHMKVAQDRGDAFPASYVTTSLVREDSSQRRDVVRGLLHVALGTSSVIFATGQHEGTGQIRMTILQPRSKLAYDAEDKPSDLAGLRLSLSEGHPEGYHVWCSRIVMDPQPAPTELQSVALEYDLARVETPNGKILRFADDAGFHRQHDLHPHEWFEKHVIGLGEILAYLDDKPIVTMG